MIDQPTLAEVHTHHPHWIRKDQLNTEERRIFDELKAGGKVQRGILKARIERRKYRQRISWRKEFEKLPAGRAKIAELTARPTVKTVEYLVLE